MFFLKLHTNLNYRISNRANMPATLESDDIHITFLNWIFTVISGSLSPAWRVLRLWMEERSPFRRVHANILN